MSADTSRSKTEPHAAIRQSGMFQRSSGGGGCKGPIKQGVIYENTVAKSTGFCGFFRTPRTCDQERDFRTASHTRSTWSSVISGWIGRDRTSRAARSASGKAPSRNPIQA